MMKKQTQKHKKQAKSKTQKGGVSPVSTPENVTNNRRMRNSNFYNEFATPSFISSPSDDESNDNNRNIDFIRGTRRRSRSGSQDSFDNLVNRLDFSGVSTSPDYNLMFSEDLESESLGSSDSHLDPFIVEKLDNELSEKIKLISKNKFKFDMDKKVFDYNNDEELSVKEFIEKDPTNNIVIRDEDENYYFVDKETIRNNRRTSILFACDEATIGWTGRVDLLKKANMKFPLYNMNSVGIENYVFQQDTDKLENDNHQLYYLIPTKTVVPSTVSLQVIGGESVISANHCQIGKGGLVFRLVSFDKLKNKNKSKNKSKKRKSKTRKYKRRLK